MIEVEVRNGVRQLDLRQVMLGAHRDLALRAAFLAGCYAFAEHLGLEKVPTELFRQEADAPGWVDEDEAGRPLGAFDQFGQALGGDAS